MIIDHYLLCHPNSYYMSHLNSFKTAPILTKNVSREKLSIRYIYFKWDGIDGKVTIEPLFHRIKEKPFTYIGMCGFLI